MLIRSFVIKFSLLIIILLLKSSETSGERTGYTPGC